MSSPRLRRPNRRTLGVCAGAIGLAALLYGLLAGGREPSPGARAATGRVLSYTAARQDGGALVFRLDRVYEFTVRSGELRLGAHRQAVPVAALRAGARAHSLRISLSDTLLRTQREQGGRPVLAVSVTERLTPARGVLLGAWHRPPGARWSAGRVAAFETAIGRRLDVDHHYYAWGTTFWPSPGIEGDDVANGRVPLISLGGQAAFPGLDAINDGSQDAFLRLAARRVARFGWPLFFRPLWEMNGDWSTWDGTHNSDRGQRNGPAKYVRAWRRMHDIFAQEGATNTVWVWSPNCRDRPRADWNHWSRYYPGDAYVDWVACDGYNRGTAQPTSSWRSFSALYGDYKHKPFMVAETGACEEGGDKSQWIDDVKGRLRSEFSNVKAFVWFDAQKLCDWRVSSSSRSFAAFRTMASDPHFNP